MKWIPASALAGAAFASAPLSWHDRLCLGADVLRERGMACILLWMQGGPSQFETFSPKPEHANGGEIGAIDTAVPGVQISANFPHVAQVADRLAIIRSMTASEGNHQRASQLMHTGYTPSASVKYPSLGSLVHQQIGDRDVELPGFVSIGDRGRSNLTRGGILGVEYDAFTMQSPDRLPDNTVPTTPEARYRRRLSLLDSLEEQTDTASLRQKIADHRNVYKKASRMILSPQMTAFDLSEESTAAREAYGEGDFAAGCLLARRLVEAGVTFVEVVSNGWDTHQENFSKTAELAGQVDQPFAQLIRDLEDRGRLDRTLVIWMGEFGRTPKINPRGGRDHYPKAFNVALAGGGARGGQVIGQTDKAGTAVSDRPVKVPDLFRSICSSLGINADDENMSPIGRPIPIVDGGAVVEELFG
ncbi:MAG: DUF1501 domain-containing protein [Pirellulales bacterium]